MASFNDLFSSKQTSTTTPSAVISNLNKNAIVASSSTVVDPQIDSIWGGNTAAYVGSDANIDPYVSYYFSGQDINVSIDGTQGNGNFQTIPVINLSFQITQPKLAIYGFWSYTYDAVARGARQIAARMEIATTYPRYLTSLLQEVAKERLANTNGAYANTAPLSVDDQNILTFWGGGAGNSQTGTTINLYQEHPPFDIIVIYGNQDVSINDWATVTHGGDNPLFVDINERLVEPASVGNPSRLILQNCEIVNMQTQYTTSGEIICESYDLMINDISLP